MICQKCNGTIFESKKAIVTFCVEGGKTSFTSDGFCCTKCGQIQVQFQVNVQAAQQVNIQKGESKCQEKILH